MFNPVGFIFFLLWTSVLGQDCIVYNFESDVDDLFRQETLVCNEAHRPWQFENYTSIEIDGVPINSTRFIAPQLQLSCDSTGLYEFSEGTLEVNIFMQSNSPIDFLAVFVTEVTDVGAEIYANVAVTRASPDYVEGWSALRINLRRTFKGYVSFMGMKAQESTVLVDSFRFYTPEYEYYCEVYDTGRRRTTTEATVEPTTEYTTSAPEMTTTADPVPLTTSPPDDTEKCVTYNFDEDFEKLFTHDHDLCRGFSKWELNEYSNGIDTSNARGRSFLSPNAELSCIAAFPIRMSPDGVVEVNVNIQPASDLDYIIVLVKNVVDGSVDTTAGTYIYEPSGRSFQRGWNVLRIKVVNLKSFDGYLMFLGGASEGSTVLVDSFRYIPPWLTADDEECQFR